MSGKPFTEREIELLKHAFQCLGDLKIDIEKFQALGGFTTAPSACSSWCRLKVKLGVNAGKTAASTTDDTTNNPATAEAETPKPKKRKRAVSPVGDSPVSSKKKRATKSTPVKEPEMLKPEIVKVEQEESPQAFLEGSVFPS